MASRFEIVDEEYIEELKDKSENENTRKSTEYCKKVAAARLGQFQQLLKTQVILILNFTRPHAITYTNSKV